MRQPLVLISGVNMENIKRSITELGNPAKPQGEAGVEMLLGMNVHHSGVTSWALSFLEAESSDIILDIGCGGGEALRRISSDVVTGKLYGVDHSDVSVRLSTEHNAKDVECGKIRIIKASVDKLPFEDNFFNKVLTVESFYFWKDPAENLKEVLRVIKKGGKLFIAADIHGDAELDEKDIEGIEKFNLFNPSLAEFRSLLENAGFINVKLHTKSGEKWVCAEGEK